jgi:Caspase domain
MSSRVFALIVGIDIYKSGNIWNLHSSVEDAKRIRRWLTDGLNAPKDQIRVLLDNQATKQKIEDSFMEHLVNNPAIEKNDAIIIYFAGHGSSLVAPPDWFQEADNTAEVQVICPYDHDTNTTQGRIAGICDRSLHALIDDLSSTKGNNITLILDCCFSPPRTPRNVLDRRIIRWTPTTKAVPDDLYRGLWSGARGQPHTSHLGFFNHSLTTHTLLSACFLGDKAVEDKEGGKFTTNLIHAMSKLPLHRTSYTHLIEHLLQTTSDSQRFVCLGQHKNRNVFNDVPFVIDKRFSLATLESDTNQLKVEIGAIHGIVEGSELSICLHNYLCSKNPPIACAVVSELHPTWCYVHIKSQNSTVPRTCWAKVSKWSNHRPFRVNLKSTLTSFIRIWKLRRTIPTKVGGLASKGGLNILRVRHAAQADISLTLGRRSVSVVQHQPIFLEKHHRVVKIENKDGLEVIDDAARFNLHLFRKNLEYPLQNLIEMELFRLDPLSWTKVDPNVLDNGEAILPYEGGAIYQIILQNKSQVDLWPYLAYMDPNRYSITTLYHPDLSQGNPPLPKQGCLEIGSGKPGSEALSFALGDHNHLDSGYFKLFLSSTPVTMNLLEQPSSLSSLAPPDYEGLPVTQSEVQVWDTAIASVTFIRTP